MVVHKKVQDYIEYRNENWIELDRRKPFVLRLDFVVADGKLVTDEVPTWLSINVNSSFELYVDGMLTGTGDADTYKFSARPSGTRPEIMIAAYDNGGRFGLLTAGSLNGYDLNSSPENWESLGNMTHDDWINMSEID